MDIIEKLIKDIKQKEMAKKKEEVKTIKVEGKNVVVKLIFGGISEIWAVDVSIKDEFGFIEASDIKLFSSYKKAKKYFDNLIEKYGGN